MKNKSLKDESWSNTCEQSKEFIDIVLCAKPNDPELNLIFWLLDQLAIFNKRVMVAVSDDWNYLINNKTLTIYNPDYKVEADKLDKHKKVIVPFWELLSATKSNGMKLRLMQSKHKILFSAIFSMYNKYQKQYLKKGN